MHDRDDLILIQYLITIFMEPGDQLFLWIWIIWMFYVVLCYARYAIWIINSAFFRHLDISRETRRPSKFKMTRKILIAIVQRLVNLVSLDISGHIMLDNCTVPHFEEAMGRPRWVTLFQVHVFRWTTAFWPSASFSLSALNLARAASILFRSWRGPCSFWAYMTPPSVMWHTSPLIRYWLC